VIINTRAQENVGNNQVMCVMERDNYFLFSSHKLNVSVLEFIDIMKEIYICNEVLGKILII
jgi:hypothetical protein